MGSDGRRGARGARAGLVGRALYPRHRALHVSLVGHTAYENVVVSLESGKYTELIWTSEARLLDFVAAVRLVGLKLDRHHGFAIGTKPAHRRLRGASDQPDR
jgi:hypothetical protein